MGEYKKRFNDDMYTGSVYHAYSMLSEAFVKAKSTDPVKVAAVMEGMKFNSFNDFNDYFNKVRMKANFKESHLSAKDVAFFAPQLADMNLSLDIDGQIEGLVTSLNAKALAIKAGKATYIKGDFIVKGLPNLKDTYMDLKIDMLGTNKKDLDELFRSTTGKSVKVIPVIVSKFGNINFNGRFTGFQNDFIAYGEFKTKLGRIVSDVNMKIST